MDDPAVFTELARNNLRVTTQQTINVITIILESFGGLPSVNDVDIDTFPKIPIMQIMPEWLRK